MDMLILWLRVQSRVQGTRSAEEIDVAAAQHKRLRIVGECKWTTRPMPLSVLTDLRDFKIPAVAEEGRLKVAAEGPEILLFSRSGFAPALETEADADPKITLIDLDMLLAGLTA